MVPTVVIGWVNLRVITCYYYHGELCPAKVTSIVHAPIYIHRFIYIYIYISGLHTIICPIYLRGN